MSLADIESGKTVKISNINTKGKLFHKLLDMGFVSGVSLEVIRHAPLYDPMEIKIHNYYVSIRKSEAQLIDVEHF